MPLYRRWPTLVSVAAITTLTAGCPKFEAPPVVTECTRQYEKCKLPSGPLGVCAEVTCRPGPKAKPETATAQPGAASDPVTAESTTQGGRGPCFKCMPQH